MDATHSPSLNPRKRKADADECTDSAPPESLSEPMLVDASVPATTSSNAPRQPSSTTWMPSGTNREVWPTTSSPIAQTSRGSTIPNAPHQTQVAKRPRIETSQSSPSSPFKNSTLSPSTLSPLSRLPGRRIRRDDTVDMGVVSTRPPGPSQGSLLRLREPKPKRSITQPLPLTAPPVPIDPNSSHIPSLQPLINRQTLKELDLDAILRNPQLRHDLLFDAGLQFRPTAGRRKRESAEKYWLAVTQELKTGCTQIALPVKTPMLAFSSSHRVLTLRTPSRIRSLLLEFLEVLLSVIQPLASISGMYVNPDTFQSQMREHAAQAAYLRSVFDADLIEQEMRHGLFDPSGLFHSIGDTLKSHCAPMRDRAVDAMVAVAATCAPGGGGGKAEAVKAVRMCMDILELMKLDIANHQLQTLRPFLIRTSGHFELKTFRSRIGPASLLHNTRQWLLTAHQALSSSRQTLPHPLYSSPISYRLLHRNQRVYISVLRALTDLVFFPPSPLPSSPPPSPISPPSPTASSTVSLPSYPETSYLDNGRLIVLSTDAFDITALYMFLLLFRQLVFSDCGTRPPSAKIEESDMLRLKKEIREIGYGQLGFCFTRRDNSMDDQPSEASKQWDAASRDIILQIAARAKEVQSRGVAPRPASQDVGHHSPIVKHSPDERILQLAERWADSNLKAGSPLSNLLRDRLRDTVFNAVLSLSYPGRDSMTGKLTAINVGSFASPISSLTHPQGMGSGMESLADEIRSLAERLSRLALIHINAYLPLYEQDNFLHE